MEAEATDLVGYSTECPECGHVEAGFRTRFEAEQWVCPDCQRFDEQQMQIDFVPVE